jgi:hypothetical protein
MNPIDHGNIFWGSVMPCGAASEFIFRFRKRGYFASLILE